MRVSKVYFVNEICSKGEMADKNKSRVGIDLMSTLNFVGVPPVLGHDTRTTPGFMDLRYADIESYHAHSSCFCLDKKCRVRGKKQGFDGLQTSWPLLFGCEILIVGTKCGRRLSST